MGVSRGPALKGTVNLSPEGTNANLRFSETQQTREGCGCFRDLSGVNKSARELRWAKSPIANR